MALHEFYPALKAERDEAYRAHVESNILYKEVQRDYPDVSTLVSWAAFDKYWYPPSRERSLADDGLVLCAAYQGASVRSKRLWEAFRTHEQQVKREHREMTIMQDWKFGVNRPHPLLQTIDDLDENNDLFVGYMHMFQVAVPEVTRIARKHTRVFRGLTKSQCPLLVEALRLLFRNRGNPRIELASNAGAVCMQGLHRYIPPILARSNGVNDIVSKLEAGNFDPYRDPQNPWMWGSYLLTAEVLRSLAMLDKYLVYPDKGEPDGWWVQFPDENELNLRNSNEGEIPLGDYGPWNAVWFAHVMAKDDRCGPSFKDVFLPYVQEHYAMFWRYKVRGDSYPAPVLKRPLFVFVER